MVILNPLRISRTILISILIVWPGSALGQSLDRATIERLEAADRLGSSSSLSPAGLIDLSRVRWSNSYSVSYFSGGGTSGSLGVLRTNLAYDFSSKLSLALNVGIAHDPRGIVGDGKSNAAILPGFTLDYHPSNRVQMRLSVQTFQGGYGAPYRNSFLYDPWYELHEWRRDQYAK